MDREDIQAVVKIIAKPSLGNQCGEVVVGSRDDTHVHMQGSVSANPLEFLFLQDTQQFGLQLERQVAHFIEKQCASVREFEPADLLRQRPGKGTALVPEELRFEQPGRNGSAIHLDEGALTARAEIVDCAGDQFLAGAGFAED